MDTTQATSPVPAARAITRRPLHEDAIEQLRAQDWNISDEAIRTGLANVRQLAGLRLSQPAQPGTPVLAEGRQVGEITSSAQSPSLGAIALAVLKRPYFTVGSRVEVADQPAEVCSLPFAGRLSPAKHDIPA